MNKSILSKLKTKKLSISDFIISIFNKKNTQKLKFYFYKSAEKYYTVLVILIGILLLTLYFSSPTVHAQQRLDLDDLEVKGELLNDDRLNILARERNELRNYVKFRNNFRPEMLEELPQPAPGVKY